MATINVPADFATIQAAINAAIAGDTIIVAAGTYIEQVTINKTLTLLGAKAGIDARTRDPSGESIIQFVTEFDQAVVLLQAPNIIIDGFTITSTTNEFSFTSAIFGGFVGSWPPLAVNDLTGLQIINNIIRNNANGITIASTEPAPLPVNYLVQYNYFQNNSGDGNFSFNGIAVLFSTNPPSIMTNVVVRENYFNGGSQLATISLRNVQTASVLTNVLNFDSSITLQDCTNITVDKNVTYFALRSGSSTSVANAINLNNTINTDITNNLIYNATSNGIFLNNNTTDTTITGNCIINNTDNGIIISGTGNTTLTINSNNIQGNVTGLVKSATVGTYTGTIDATSNYWDSPTGPNYNSTGLPGSGQIITDPGTPQVDFDPFLTGSVACPSPITVVKTSSTTNVDFGTPIEYTYTLTVNPDDVNFQLTGLIDTIPTLNSGSQWQIISENPPGFFTIIPGNPQSLAFNFITPTTVSPGTYTVTIQAPTEIEDAGQILDNTATTSIQIGGLPQSYDRLATASVALCLHSSSKIKLADGTEKRIADIKAGDVVIGGNGSECSVIEQVPCLVMQKYWTRAIVLEPNSLAPGVPSELLAIDPGHPICTPSEYELLGDSALKPAKSYLLDNQIYYKGWKTIPDILPGENRRYDLVLDSKTSQTYVANGVVVSGRKNRLEPGYDYV